MAQKTGDQSSDIKSAETDAVLNQRFAKPRGRPPKKLPDENKQFWHDAMMVTLQALQVKSPDKVQQCTAIADEYIRILNERFK